VLFYDADCLMCQSFVVFIAKKDRSKKIFFSNFSSAFAQSLGLRIDENTLVLYHFKKTYRRSQAVYQIMSILSFPKGLLFIFRLIPRPIADFTYKIIARNRHLFGFSGMNQACHLEIADRILS
jgi:predicted DCC family thiol-disulfide oxidoreductase YuxK